MDTGSTDPVENAGLVLVCQDPEHPGKEGFAWFRNTLVEFKIMLHFEDAANRGIGDGKEQSKHFGGNSGNLLAKISDLFIPVFALPEIRSSQNSGEGCLESYWNYRHHALYV